MFQMRLLCYLVSGRPLPLSTLDALYDAASTMFRERQRKHRLRHDDVQGEVRTEFRPGLLGTFAGSVFEADIETAEGSTFVRYLACPPPSEEEVAWRGWRREDDTPPWVRDRN